MSLLNVARPGIIGEMGYKSGKKMKIFAQFFKRNFLKVNETLYYTISQKIYK
jgi:hypothetical protein